MAPATHTEPDPNADFPLGTTLLTSGGRPGPALPSPLLGRGSGQVPLSRCFPEAWPAPRFVSGLGGSAPRFGSVLPRVVLAAVRGGNAVLSAHSQWCFPGGISGSRKGTVVSSVSADSKALLEYSALSVTEKPCPPRRGMKGDGLSQVSGRWWQVLQERGQAGREASPVGQDRARRWQARCVDNHRSLLPTPGLCLGPAPGTCSVVLHPGSDQGTAGLDLALFLTSLPVHCVFFLSDVDLHLFIPYLTTSPGRLIPLLADCGHPFLTPLPKAKRWRRGLKSWPLRVSWPEPDPPPWNELTARFTSQRTGGW